MLDDDDVASNILISAWPYPEALFPIENRADLRSLVGKAVQVVPKKPRLKAPGTRNEALEADTR